MKQIDISEAEDPLEAIRAYSADTVTVTFVGVGSAFATKNCNTSIIVGWKGESGVKTMLVDIGRNVPEALLKANVDLLDFDYYHFTHIHPDHVGGVGDLLLKLRYFKQRKAKVIITPAFEKELWDNSLRGGIEINENPPLIWSDVVDPIYPDNFWVDDSKRERHSLTLDGLKMLLFKTLHTPGFVTDIYKANWSNGLILNDSIIWTGDTRYDPDIIKMVGDKSEVLFHDAQLFNPGIVHASFDELNEKVPKPIKKITHLMHYGDEFEGFKPENDGFAGFVKPWVIYK